MDAVHYEASERMEGEDSEMYANRSDAEMEIASDINQKNDIEQEYFEKEKPVFANLLDR